MSIPPIGGVSLQSLTAASQGTPATGAGSALGLQEEASGASGALAAGEAGALQAGEGLGAGAAQAGGAGEGASFGSALGEAISSLQSTQQSASTAAQGLATGTVKDPENAVMTVEDAQLAMDLAAQIRTKATEAVQTIFQTQV